MINQDSGAIALVGSGEYSLQMQELETELLHLAISKGKKNTFVQIPTASSHEGQSRREHWQSLGKEQADRIGSQCVYLPIHEREDAFNLDFLDLIADAGLIYFSGEIHTESPKSLAVHPCGKKSLSNGIQELPLLGVQLALWLLGAP